MATSISSEEMAQIDAEMAKAGRGHGLDSRFRERIKKALSMGVDIDVIANLIGVSKLGDVKKLREWFETQRYGTDLSAMDDDAVEDLIESLQGEVEDIAELEENRFYKDATIRDSDVHSDTYGQTIPRIEDGKPFGYVMPDEWIEGHEERMGVSPFDADPIKALVKRYIFGNYGHMPQSEYDAMVKKLTDLQSMQRVRERGYNRGGITNFRPMGAVPTSVGMPMHMPRPPRGQMPPPGMQRGGIVGYQNRGQVEGPLPPHLQMRPSWTPGEDEADIEEVIIDREDWHVTYRALVEELERFQQLANSTGYTVEEIIENRRGQGSLDPTAAAQMFEMLEEQREVERNRELGERLGPMFGPQAGAGKAGPGLGGMMDPDQGQGMGYGGNKEEWARKRAEAAALYDRGFQGGGVVTPFGMSLADTAEMASFSSQAQAAPNGGLRGGIMSGQEAPGSGALGALSRQEFGTGRSLLPSFTTEERGIPGVEAQESWEVEPRYGRFYKSGGLTGQANKVAGAGRYGDTELVHMNPAEVQGLASLVPMTINPETGKPEAFLGMLMALLGQYVAPMIAASSWGSGLAASGGLSGLLGTALSSPTALSALGSTAGTWAETGDLEKGILSGMMSFGIGSALNQVGLTGDEFIKSGATGQGALAGTTVADPLTAGISAGATPAAVPSGPWTSAGFGGTAPTGLSATATPAMRDAVAARVGADTMKANQAIFNQQSLGTRLGHAGSNIATKEGISALMNPATVAMIASGAGGLGAIRSEEEFLAMIEDQKEDKKRRRAEMWRKAGFPSGEYSETIPQGVRQRFGLPGGNI